MTESPVRQGQVNLSQEVSKEQPSCSRAYWQTSLGLGSKGNALVFPEHRCQVSKSILTPFLFSKQKYSGCKLRSSHQGKRGS